MHSSKILSAQSATTQHAIIALCCLILPLPLVFSSFHDADSVLTAFMSTKSMTWYFWGQNRLGNIIPFLTTWCKPIEENFILQVYLRSLFGFVSILCVLEITEAYKRSTYIEEFLFGIAALFLFSRQNFYADLFIQALPYGTSLAFVFFASWALRKIRHRPTGYLTSFSLFWLAFFANISLPILLLPLYGLIFVLRKRRADFELGLMAGLATLGAYGHAQLFEPQTPLQFVKNDSALAHGMNIIVDHLDGDHLLILLGAVALLQCLRRQPRTASIAAPAPAPENGLSIAIACLLFTAIIMHIGWVATDNASAGRYFAVPVTLGLIFLSSSVVTKILPSGARWQTGWRVALLCTAIGAIGTVAQRFQPPIVVLVTDGKPFKMDKRSALFALPDDRPIVIVGNFWRAWPASYYLSRAQPHNDRIFTISDRWEPMGESLRAALSQPTHLTLVCLDRSMDICEAALRNNVAERTVLSFNLHRDTLSIGDGVTYLMEDAEVLESAALSMNHEVPARSDERSEDPEGAGFKPEPPRVSGAERLKSAS